MLIGEMRDIDSIQIALTMAETGHLFLGRCTLTTRLKRLTELSTCFRHGARSKPASSWRRHCPLSLLSD